MAAVAVFKMVVFNGSTRDGRMSDRVVKFLEEKLVERRCQVEILDPKELEAKGVTLLKQPLHFYPDRTKAPQVLQDINVKIEEADAFIFVSAEYNALPPPALLNLIDHLPPPSFAYKPAAVVAYSLGPFGGIRASTSLRSHLAELGCLVSPAGCTIPTVQKAVKEDGSGADERVEKNITRMLSHLEWYADALREKRRKDGAPQ